MKTYQDVFKQAQEHSQSQDFYDVSIVRLHLADAIRNERNKQSLSMAKLATLAGTTPAIICRIENAQMSTGIDLIMRIYKALGKQKIELTF
jgi:ribosome-binding protein aMBF1 (putative translation factor)